MNLFDTELNETIERLENELEMEAMFKQELASLEDELASDSLLPELDFH
ncbi:hypothetical protein [Alteromonas sp. BMJM2]|nr:hypothetical protein [Alteromonas sp. BMJM2]